MRVVAKIGTSSLTDAQGVIDTGVIDALCDQLAVLRAAGHEVILVSSGAVSAGVSALGLPERPSDVVTLQAISAAGQSRLMETYNRSLGRHSLVAAQVLLVPHDFVDRRQYLHARQTLVRLLEQRRGHGPRHERVVDAVSLKIPKLGGLRNTIAAAHICEAGAIKYRLGAAVGSCLLAAHGMHLAAALPGVDYACELAEHAQRRRREQALEPVSACGSERTRERGMREFLDEKKYRPGLQPVSRPSGEK